MILMVFYTKFATVPYLSLTQIGHHIAADAHLHYFCAKKKKSIKLLMRLKLSVLLLGRRS